MANISVVGRIVSDDIELKVSANNRPYLRFDLAEHPQRAAGVAQRLHAANNHDVSDGPVPGGTSAASLTDGWPNQTFEDPVVQRRGCNARDRADQWRWNAHLYWPGHVEMLT